MARRQSSTAETNTTTKPRGRKASPGGSGAGAGSRAGSRAGAPAVPPDIDRFVPAPKPLDAIVGQDRAVTVLDAVLGSGRVHHAWIFHGPTGVGKFTAAVSFASILLDPTSEPGLTGVVRPDPGSAVQELLAGQKHPDLHVIVKELARFSGESQVRKSKLITIPKSVVDEHLIGPAMMGPSRREHGVAGKVFIVDEAELLDRSPNQAPTQNALLKTLEEPPAGTVIILVTSNEDRLLPTIRSRCQRVAFGALSLADMERWVDANTSEPSFADWCSADPSEKAWLQEFAAGSPGRMLTALSTGMLGWHREMREPLAQLESGRFPPALAGMIAGLIDDWAKGWVDAHTNASKDSANREAARHMLSMLGERYRCALRRVTGSGQADGPGVGSGRDPGIMAAALADAIDQLDRAQRDMDANVQMQFVTQRLVAGLADAFSD